MPKALGDIVLIKTGGVLCAFAHPDDEQFGTSGALIKCVQRGIPVQVLCATRGDAGEISDPALATRENLAQVREQELRTACAMLGFEPPVMLDYLDGHLPDVPPTELRDHVVAAIRTFKPRVVITFDENGGYGHPDHIAIHHATLAAWKVAGDGTFRPDLGAPHQPDKLYASSYRRSYLMLIDDELRALGENGLDLGSVQTIPKEELGSPDELLTTVVQVEELYELRMAAMFAHRTQFGDDTFMKRFPDALARKLVSNDSFRRIHPSPSSDANLPDEDDLWAGLPVYADVE
jgi:LmbE family N-acetylglucosaminyl deacetylase